VEGGTGINIKEGSQASILSSTFYKTRLFWELVENNESEEISSANFDRCIFYGKNSTYQDTNILVSFNNCYSNTISLNDLGIIEATIEFEDPNNLNFELKNVSNYSDEVIGYLGYSRTR